MVTRETVPECVHHDARRTSNMTEQRVENVTALCVLGGRWRRGARTSRRRGGCGTCGWGGCGLCHVPFGGPWRSPLGCDPRRGRENQTVSGVAFSRSASGSAMDQVLLRIHRDFTHTPANLVALKSGE